MNFVSVVCNKRIITQHCCTQLYMLQCCLVYGGLYYYCWSVDAQSWVHLHTILTKSPPCGMDYKKHHNPLHKTMFNDKWCRLYCSNSEIMDHFYYLLIFDPLCNQSGTCVVSWCALADFSMICLTTATTSISSTNVNDCQYIYHPYTKLQFPYKIDKNTPNVGNSKKW